MGRPFALTYTLSLALAGVASGRTILKRLRLQEPLTVPESAFFALPLGLGLLMLCILVLGVVGLLRPFLLAGLVVGSFDRVSAGLDEVWSDLSPGLRGLPLTWDEASAIERMGASLVVLIAAGSLLLALVPAWSYDALVYHLAAPKQYLATGRLLFLPDVWQADGPMGIELLYTLGLAMGSTSVAKICTLS